MGSKAIYWELRRLYHFYRGLQRLGRKSSEAASSYPKVVNLNANDVCNSACTMCNIWKQKETHISPTEFGAILKDPLYREVDYVGITGGEPTLRTDLASIYEEVICSLPSLKGVSIITNGINSQQVVRRLEEVIAVCKRMGKPFSIMFSLDGVGHVHDEQRGIEGNFNSVDHLLDYFRTKHPSIPLSIGATITKNNVAGIDSLFEYAQQKGVYIRFRIAEFIERLYNADRTEVIRKFSQDETYALSLFFSKLEHQYEQNQEVKYTYQNIVHMLNGGNRIVGCPYQEQGVVLNSKGGIAYCAPKSPEIGNALVQDSQSLFFGNLETRNKIRSKDCDNCIHDYHTNLSMDERKRRYKEAFYASSFYNLSTFRRSKLFSPWLKKPRFKHTKSVLIVGWYGTETVGDKAILAGIVEELRSELGVFDLTIASIYPFLTEQTCRELDIEARVIGVKNLDLLRYARYCDKTIMGGGPLMGIEELYIPLVSIFVAQKYGRQAIVQGCGLGPFVHQHHVAAIRDILSLATAVSLRDSDSVRLAEEQFGVKAKLTSDPAKIAVSIEAERKENAHSKNELACFLREWTWEYDPGSSYESFVLKRTKMEAGLARFIQREYEKSGCDSIKFYHMHNFVIGNDDRDFSRRFVATYFSDIKHVTIQEELSTVRNICYAMKSSKMNICMRFHSVLFAETLSSPFLAIDYTQGGKIKGFLKDQGKEANLVQIEDLINHEFN